MDCVGVGLRGELQRVGYPPGSSSEKQIIPITEIQAKLTREVIKGLLDCPCEMNDDKAVPGDVDRLVDKILGNHPACPPAIKILALLVLVKQSHLIIKLMEHRFNDTNYEQLSVERLTELFKENVLEPTTIRKISERKWRLNPPVLVCDGLHENFQTDIMMPFDQSKEPIGTGSYGRVYEVEIHPSYQRLVEEDLNNPVRFPH